MANGFSDAKDPDRAPDQRDNYVAESITIATTIAASVPTQVAARMDSRRCFV